MLSPLVRIVALLVLCVLGVEATTQTVPDWARSADGTVAQAPDAFGGGDPPPPPPPPPQVPIDGGLGLLALAGGAYAVRRLRGRSNKKEV